MSEVALEGGAVDNAASQGHFVGIFQLVAHSDAACDDREAYAGGCQFAVDVEVGRVAFHRRAQSQYDLGHTSRLDALHEAFYLQVAGADAVDGRDDSAQDVVEAVVLLGGFDGHDIADVFDYTHGRGVAPGVGTDAAGLRVRDVVAHAAELGLAFQRGDGAGKGFYRAEVLAEQVEHQAHGSLTADARQLGKLGDGSFEQYGWELFVHLLSIRFRGAKIVEKNEIRLLLPSISRST